MGYPGAWLLAVVALVAAGVIGTQAAIDTENVTISWETRLVQDLVARYRHQGRISRPMKNSTGELVLRFGLRLITLDLNEKTQTLSTSAWLRHRWTDEYLTWEPEEYGGVRYVILPPEAVWMPEDITLVNTAEADLDLSHVSLQVKYTGRVFYAPHAVYKSGCLVDLTNYPYDVQTCDLWIQSASRYSWDIRLEPYAPTPLDLDTYLGSFKDAKDWDVIGNATEYVDTPREHGAILMYSRRGALRFTFTLRRRLGFMGVLLLLPCVFLAMMIPIIFCLPTERPDRHMLAMSLFASFMVLLLILTQNAPPSAASVPKLGEYYCINLLLIIVAIFISVFVIFVNRRAESKQIPPRWVKFVLLRLLAPLLCLGTRSKMLLGTPPQNAHAHNNGEDEKLTHVDTTTAVAAAPSLFPNTQQLQESARFLQGEKPPAAAAPAASAPGTRAQQQWRLITLVLDRFFAVFFFLVNIIAFIVMLPWPGEDWK